MNEANATNQLQLFSFSEDPVPSGRLQWFNTPSKLKYNALQQREDDCHGRSVEGGLRIWPAKGTDFWQRTFYDPAIIKDDGHLLYGKVGNWTVAETSFEMKAINQFDQAGIMVRKDNQHWIKAGIEFVDGFYRLSVVVTNGYSDWSTQVVKNGIMSLRLYRQGSSFVVEAKNTAELRDWQFVRICHLNVDENEKLDMGIFTCCPKECGFEVLFNSLNFNSFTKYGHSADHNC